MEAVIFAVLLCISSALAMPPMEPLQDPNWKAWKSFHGKEYPNKNEETMRNFIWQNNLKKIVTHNEGKHSFKLAMNHLGDMTSLEISQTLLGLKLKKHAESQPKGATFLPPANVKVVDSIDWRSKGYVTPVKNQGQCGSCWAFSTTGALEGQHFRKTGKLVSLSEQNLVDCSGKYGNNGCEGGLMDNAFQYIKENGGIDTEKSYPYLAKDGVCHYNKSAIGAKDTGFVDIPTGDENALQQALASVGPISIAIDASQSTFHFYHQGVYDDPDCSSTRLDHGVLAVGYGTDDGKDYWLVKNSWGPSWGEEGYIKIARNDHDKCGVASKASYPLV
ncbi:predicted protein [Nematostella vectensis]|uniref:Cathepsin L n=1 Tax=Nematostella vectensis TaxID=45351 RepID=A7RRL9_NEMVE|nr:procathepsin L [Nematostella vectensis]EDO45852.1 predicted protein [Nematostella vectensis]|eukprot:XP_001637915.1 predicted protein [Nematostella vectensis]